MICALHRVSEMAFIGAVILLVMFWTCLLIGLAGLLLGRFEEPGVLAPIGILSALNSGLLFALSLTCGMHAKWLRHRLVSNDPAYLDADGTCCGGSCAGSCGDGGCGDEGCSPEGCDDPDCCKKTDDACGCGDSCICADMGGCDDGCDSCGETCGCTDRSGEEKEGGCCGGGCCK